MKYVYILESLDSEHFYVGITDDLRARLAKHNAGEVPHTSKYGPWRIRTYFAFDDAARAVAFERYLKSGSGRAFAKEAFLIARATPPYSPITAFSRSRSATISSFIDTSSDTEQSEAARIDCGTLRAFSFSACPCAVSAIRT
ncbi:putative GIY-YIG superfamily endonuclease [Bradyrhizobium ottawaense]